jgi:hypothetical protein
MHARIGSESHARDPRLQSIAEAAGFGRHDEIVGGHEWRALVPDERCSAILPAAGGTFTLQREG